MSMISIQTPKGTAQVRVIENAFTEMFLDHFRTVTSTYTGQSVYRRIGNSISSRPQRYMEPLAQLVSVTTELTEITGTFPYQVDPTVILKFDQGTQDLLNQLHRSFTTAYRCMRPHRDPRWVWNDRFPSDFIIPEGKMDRIQELLILLNDLVHTLEEGVTSPNRTFLSQFCLEQVEIQIAGAFDPKKNIRSIYKDLDPKYYSYFSDSKKYDVWVGIDILGKEYLNAFRDNDDASCWDVSHNLGITGKMYFEISDKRKMDVLNTTEFRSWLAQSGVEYNPYMCGLPIGSVVSGHDCIEYLRRPTNGIVMTVTS